jgi:hypothetical protein
MITGLMKIGDRKDLEGLQNRPEWPPCRELDRDVSDFRKFLDEWVAKRDVDGGVLACFQRVPQIAWPELQEAEDLPYADESEVDKDGMPVLHYGMRTRRDAIKNGQYVFRWERPPKWQLAMKGAEVSTPSENPSQMGNGKAKSTKSRREPSSSGESAAPWN